MREDIEDMNQKGIERFKIQDLKIGMYVILPLSWHRHPFLKNEFLVESVAELEKIKALDLTDIVVDRARSRPIRSDRGPNDSDAGGAEHPAALNIARDALLSAIGDTRTPPERKAEIVRKASIAMMKNLFDEPTAENIREAKKGISEMVKLILKEDETLYHLLNITSHDHYTYTHSVSVGVLAVALAKSLFRDAKNHDMSALGAGFFLHDLGKVHIDNRILNKPAKLDDDEMHTIRRHPTLGFNLLHHANQLTDESRVIVLQHHERFDGLGYPKGLRGADIHVYARICSIADVYDALTSDRPYRKKMSPFDALALMRREMMYHFQKDLFERFVLLFRPPE